MLLSGKNNGLNMIRKFPTLIPEMELKPTVWKYVAIVTQFKKQILFLDGRTSTLSR
jgi:hypothetical protein